MCGRESNRPVWKMFKWNTWLRLACVCACVCCSCINIMPCPVTLAFISTGPTSSLPAHILFDSIPMYSDHAYKSFISTAGYNNLEVAEYLLEHGADVNAQDKGGLIPLHNAASYGVSTNQTRPLVKQFLISNWRRSARRAENTQLLEEQTLMWIIDANTCTTCLQALAFPFMPLATVPLVAERWSMCCHCRLPGASQLMHF